MREIEPPLRYPLRTRTLHRVALALHSRCTRSARTRSTASTVWPASISTPSACGPRSAGPQPPEAVKPRTTLLRHGLDAPVPVRYQLHEEEVPRAGARVHQSFQRTRWYDGKVVVWFGARKETGRGEKSSGLAFDGIKPKATGAG